MSIKKFSIYTSIILSVMIVASIICCFITIPSPLKFKNDPTTITVYDYSQSSTGKITEKTNVYSNEYNKLLKEFKNTTNLTVFQRIASGANIYKKPSQDLKQTKPTWSSVKGGVTIEITFKEKESMVLYVNGNTKKIDFVSLAMVVSSSNLVHEAVLYFKSPTDKNYNSTPILIQMKTNGLNRLIRSINFKK